MNEIQILKEIAYYSKFIDQQKKQMWNYNTNNKYVTKPQNTYNKYKYVKKESTVIAPAPVQNEVVNRVLINPNFKQTVLINPHFNAQNREIHVNPKVLNTQLSTGSFKPTNNEPKQVVLPQSYVKQNILPKHTTQCLSNSSTKLSPRKRRVSIRSKYKIVKSSCINPPAKLSDSNKYRSIKNQYKIDRRRISNVSKSAIKKKVVIHGISDMLRHNVFKNKTWKKSLLLNQFKSHNTRLTNISGFLYKKTQTKLQKIQPTSSNPKQRKSVVIKDQKYTIGLNRKSLKLVSLSSKINKSIRKTTKLMKHKQFLNKFIKANHLTLNNSRKLKKLSGFQARNKLRVNNQPCPVYRRYGKCRRKDSGRCYFLHNPNQIFLCKKFLQGACIDKDCLLSHKVSLEKMPTCKYFLEGCCIRNDCSYLHVKINPKADICRKFLEGFCEKGSQCNLRHQFLCPNFERNGSCPKRKCMYPHKSKVEEKLKMKVRLEKKEDVGTQELPVESARYYADIVDIGEKHDEQVNVIDNDTNSDLCSSDCDEKPRRRPRLGTLPSYIPFD